MHSERNASVNYVYFCIHSNVTLVLQSTVEDMAVVVGLSTVVYHWVPADLLGLVPAASAVRLDCRFLAVSSSGKYKCSDKRLYQT